MTPLTASRPLRILFVEDNDYLREMMAALLEADDREIVTAASGEEALASWQGGAFDVLVTDVSLPGISGLDLARAVLAPAPSTWVVLSSGYPLDHGLATLGPNVRSLPKPFESEAMDALLAEVRAAWPGR